MNLKNINRNHEENSSNFKNVIRVIRIFDFTMKIKLVGILILMVVSAFIEMLNISLFLPLMYVFLGQQTNSGVLHKLFDTIGITVEGGNSLELETIAVIVIATFILKNIVILIVIYCQAKFVAGMRAHFTMLLVRGYANREYEEHLTINSASAVHDMLNTAPSVVGGILNPSLNIVLEALLASGALTALILIDPVAALLAGSFMLFAMVVYYYMTRGAFYRISGRSLALSRLQSRYSHFFLGGIKESIVLHRRAYFIDRIRVVVDGIARTNVQSTVLGQIPRIYGETAIVCAIIVVTTYLIHREGSVQAAVALLAVFAAAAFRVLPSANRITSHLSSLRQTAPQLEAVYDDILGASLNMANAGRCIGADPRPSSEYLLKTDIVLRDIFYRYRTAPDVILHNINIRIQKGQVIGFVGRTGAGKSTLIDILLGLLVPTSGQIEIDGVPVVPGPKMWNERIGYVPQSIFLMDDTLRRNIALGVPDEDIDERQISKVIEIARLDDVVAALPAGLDSEIGERGIRLSGGQRQRIGIARALYSNPEILVLDEATSALDNSTERDIVDAIETLAGQKTILVIAHRLETVRRCAMIFYLENGTIKESGSFDFLVNNCPSFQKMVMQAGMRDGVLAGQSAVKETEATK